MGSLKSRGGPRTYVLPATTFTHFSGSVNLPRAWRAAYVPALRLFGDIVHQIVDVQYVPAGENARDACHQAFVNVGAVGCGSSFTPAWRRSRSPVSVRQKAGCRAQWSASAGDGVPSIIYFGDGDGFHPVLPVDLGHCGFKVGDIKSLSTVPRAHQASGMGKDLYYCFHLCPF